MPRECGRRTWTANAVPVATIHSGAAADFAFAVLFVCGPTDREPGDPGFASLVFYGWWDARFVPLLLAHCTVAWAGPVLARKTGRRGFIDAAVTLQFLSLAIFKYTNFLVANIEQALSIALPKSEIFLPIGISFYTFQLFSYLVDVRRGAAPGIHLGPSCFTSASFRI